MSGRGLRSFAGALALATVLITTQVPSGAVTSPYANMTWKVVTTLPKGTLASSYVYSISCPTSRACLAVGGAGQIQASDVKSEARIGRSTNGGLTWKWSAPMANTYLIQIACESATVCVAVGSTLTSPTPLALLTTDGGAAWHKMRVPAGTAPFWSVACTVRACVAGTGGKSGTAGSMLRVKGTARTWTPTPITWPAGVVTQTVFSLACPRRFATCYGIASDATSPTASAIGAYVVASHDNGLSWTVGIAATGASAVNGPTFLSCASLKVCQYGGQNGLTLFQTKTGFTGASAIHAQRYAGVQVKWGMACLDATHCELAGAVNAGCQGSQCTSSIGTVATSSSPGGPWTAQPLPPGTADLQDIVCPTSTICLAAEAGNVTASSGTSPNSGGILRLH